MTVLPDETSLEQPRRRIAKARWAILRNALLHRADGHENSIHRFEGYNLVQRRPVNSLEVSRIELSLSEYRWNFSLSLDENLNQITIVILALSACFPKGKCIRVISEYRSSVCWLISLQKRCQPSVGVWTVKEEEMKGQKWNDGDSLSSANDTITSTLTTTTTLLVRETSTSTKYRTLLYDLVDSNNDNSSNNENHYYVNKNKTTKDSDSLVIQDGYPPPFLRFIWTREPKEKRLSLDDLVSHRSNKGVDNTGNICVWDSERTLAFLLYNYFDDFFTLTNTRVIGNDNYDNKHTIVSSCHDDDDNDDDSNDDDDGCGPEYEHNDIGIGISPDEDSEIRIMELGSGMCGMAAVALGFRVEILLRQRQQQQQQQQYNRTDNECGDNNTTTKNHENKNKRMPVHIVLTDGNPDGVTNNTINQYMTRLSSQIWQKQEIGNVHSCYQGLNINCEFLLWTTDCGNDIDGDDSDQRGKEQRRRQHRYQDVILVSDCVHFQIFHAALAITTFQCLRVGGTAIFCQPTRGPSLDNFVSLLTKAMDQPERKSSLSSPLSQSNNNLRKNNSPLLRCSWLIHPIVEQKHKEACSKHNNAYDENLHRPKILVITKLREISEEDRLRFIANQQQYSPTKPTIG
mmetsp:Transcript_27767/g.31207  ORF Transcript_27767/g.31207 Transcript_27767/m.31207 type:complete len:629 (-) Transcript_27767:73-1959(-)